MSRPLSLTVIWCVAKLATATCALPIVNCARVVPPPHIPLPAFQPFRSEVTVTFSPTGQYSWGRRCSSRLLNQCQPPGTGRDSVTVKRWSTAVRAASVVIKWSKRITIGWATPTVRPSGKTVAVTVATGVTVRNVEVTFAATPADPNTVAVTWYEMPGASGPVDCHRFPEAESVPKSGHFVVVTARTAVRRPALALTTTRPSSATSTAPGFGSNVTAAARAARNVRPGTTEGPVGCEFTGDGNECGASTTFTAKPAQSAIATIAAITPPDQRDHMPLPRTQSASRVDRHSRYGDVTASAHRAYRAVIARD